MFLELPRALCLLGRREWRAPGASRSAGRSVGQQDVPVLLWCGPFPAVSQLSQHSWNDPSAGDSQLHPRAPLSTPAFPFQGDFSNKIWLFLPLWSTKCIHLGASHLCAGMESIPSEWITCCLPDVLLPWAATSILLPLLAAGSLPSHSLISCNTTLLTL